MASSNHERAHQALDELSDDEIEVFFEVFTERRKHETPALALRAGFVEVYRARDAAAGDAVKLQPARSD
jgi:hypothetical protein